MCYGTGCQWEDYAGECRKPWNLECPCWGEQYEGEPEVEPEEEGEKEESNEVHS